MNSLKVGSIIKVSDQNEPDTIGVIIDVSKNNLICFNIDQNKNPVFYKVDLSQVSYSLENGNINTLQFLDIKVALLKYYHIHKDNKDEIKVLQKVMDFAYPNGIPELTDNSNHLSSFQKEDSQLLEAGTQVKIKCYPNSTISFLDSQVLDILDFFEKGIRVLKRGSTSDSNKYYSLFYRDPLHDKTLAGVKEMIILPQKSQISLPIMEQLKLKIKNDTEKESGFISQIMDPRGNIYELNSSTLSIKSLDNKQSGLYYPGTDEINISMLPVRNLNYGDAGSGSQGESDNESVENIFIDDDDNFSVPSCSRSQSPDTILPVSLTPKHQVLYDDEDNIEEDADSTQCGSPSTIPLDLNLDLPLVSETGEDDITELEEINLSQIGGVKEKSDTVKTITKTTDIDFESDIVFDMSVDPEELDKIKSKMKHFDKEEMKSEFTSAFTSTSDTEQDSEYEIEDFDIADEPIELSKVVYRSKKVPVPEEKKIYEPQIQKSEFFKYLLEKYVPNKQLRKNNFLINQVHKINNRIVDLKDQLVNLKKLNPQNKNGEDGDENEDENGENDEMKARTNTSYNEDEVIFNQNNKPLLNAYLKNDYRNKFLIPVVLDRKKLYFPSEVTDYHYEYYSSNSNILYKNHQQIINDLNNMIEQKASSKISSITYFQLEKAINEMLKPYKVNDDSKMIGLIGHNADKIPEHELPFADYTGLVVRFNKAPFKNQGIDFQESEIEGYNLRTPLIYYVDKFKEKTDEDFDKEEDEFLAMEDVEKEWIHEEEMETSLANKPNVKKIQEGERFNIIGYLALPLKHAFNKHQIYYDSLSGLYEKYQSTTGIEEKVIDLESDLERPLEERHKPTFYYYPEQSDINQEVDHAEYLNRLIPDFKEICREHAHELKESKNWSELESIIENYGYNLRYLNVEDWEMLATILDEHLESETYHLSKRWIDYQKYLQHESPLPKPSVRVFPLVDKNMVEGLETYYDSYPSMNRMVDSDTTRLAWALQKDDHGKLLELLLAKNQLIEDEKNINKGEIERELVKIRQDVEILEGRYKQELKSSSYYDEKSTDTCRDKPKYQVAKTYQSVRDLERDNYIIAKTVPGNMDIKSGQYAIVKENNKVYIRKDLPNNTQVWDLTKITVEQIEQLVTQDCQTPAFDNLKDIVNGDSCQVQKDDMKCYPANIDRVYREMKTKRKYMAVLEAELEEINLIDVKKRKLEQNINKAKSFLSTHRNLKKLERENQLMSYRQIIEDVKKAKQRVKDCPHFQVLHYFTKMKQITPNERYSLSHMILEKFQDFTPQFLRDILNRPNPNSEGTNIPIKDMEEVLKEYGRYDIVNSNTDFNWTYCSLCHQKLICNHELYAYNLIQQTGELNETLLKDLYGVEIDQNYNCKVCGEFLVAAEDIDMDGFVKNANKNDARMVTREIIDQEVERREVRKNILDELLDEAESKNDEESKDMKLFLTTLQTLKSLSRVKLLGFDEEDIISYIKSQPFLTREYFKEYLKKTAGAQVANPQLLEYQATQFFYRFALCDITARFLVTLQTSEMNYKLSNDICKGNLEGFPLGPLEDMATAHYFVCLLQKMGGLPEFSFLSKEPNLENRFVGRLRLMAQNQNIQIRYSQAIERKAKELTYEDPFSKNPTNFWLGFRPCMGVLDAGWAPQHVIDPFKVNKIVISKYNNFMTDLRANLSNVSTKILDNLNSILSKENPSVSYAKIVKLANSCCLTQIKEGVPNGYFDYIFQKEPQMKNLIDNLRELDNLKFTIEKRIGMVALPPTFMKVESIYKLDPYYHINQPFQMSNDFKNKLYEMYVDKGINKGAPRSFNVFDICTLSGESKAEIKQSERNDFDYSDLVTSIQNKGKLHTPSLADLSHQKIITHTIQNYLDKNKEVKKGEFLHSFLTKLVELMNDEELEISSKTSKTPKYNKSFEIEKHWSKLDQQINQELESLVKHLSTIRKDPEIKNKLFRMGDYSKIYQEDDLKDIKDFSSQNGDKDDSGSGSDIFKEANNKRQIRMEKNLKHYLFNFFRSSLAIIKNNAFDKYRSFDMNPQWKYLIYYKDYQPLFKRVFEIFNGFTNDLELFNGTRYKYFNYHNCNNLLKCIMLISLNRMIDIQPEKEKEKGFGKSKKNQLLSKVGQEEVDLVFDGESKTEEELRIFNLKIFSDQKIIILYVSQIIDRIVKEEEDFNQLTQSYMITVANRKLEERNRKNLKLITILAQDGKKDLRKVIMDQKRLGLIDYEDFEDILAKDIQAGEDTPAFDRDMEIIDQLNELEGVDGHVIEEKKRQKLLDYEVEEDEYSYVAGEDDDIDEF